MKPFALLTFASAAAFSSLSADAASVIYEGFSQDVGTLSGQAGGTGLGTWAGNSTAEVISGSTTFGSLPVSGNKVTGGNNSTAWAPIGTSLSDPGLLNHGEELWFSVVLLPHGGANGYAYMGLSSESGNIGANFVTGVPTDANMAGVWFQNGSDLDIVHAIDGVPATRNRVQNNLSLVDPTFVVGKFTWGADGSADDLFEVFLPGTDLVLPGSAADSSTFVIDQASFSFLSLWVQRPGAEFDEIRYGATYEDVITNASTIPSPTAAIAGLIGLAGLGMRRRRGK